MRVILDTNVLVAALVARGIVRDLVIGNPGVFAIPDACMDEVWESRAAWNRRAAPDPELREDLDWFADCVVEVVPRESYRDREEEASRLTPDADDVPVVALALAVENDGIWTFNTRDFGRRELLARVRVLTTADVRWLLESSS